MAVALQIFLITAAVFYSSPATATWCVVRSDASDQDLQMALDYACSAGADCAPIQSSGLCFLPNTVQAHASYAFNSYYQRRGNAAGSCSFGGIAAIATTDPSYGSCMYPSSPSTAGAATTIPRGTATIPGGMVTIPGGTGSTSTTIGLPYSTGSPMPAGPSEPESGVPTTYGNGGGGGAVGFTPSVPVPSRGSIKAIKMAVFIVIWSCVLQTM